LFGSYAKGVPTEASDIDLVVEFERPLGFKFIELTEYLEQLLGQKVDILTPAGIQGIRSPHIAQSIGESIVADLWVSGAMNLDNTDRIY
jgi:predicted nucleotidyltransferase